MRVILRGASYRMDQSPKCEQYTKSVEEKPLPETNDNCHLPTLVPKCSRPHKQSDRTSNRSYIQLQVSLHISETRLAGPAYPYELGIPRHKKRPMVHTFQWHSAGAADCSQEVLLAWLVLGTGLDETLEQSLSSCMVDPAWPSLKKVQPGYQR